MGPLRSVLFAPGNRSDLIAKFPQYRADAFAIDLEDGTPESEKAAARQNLPRLVGLLRDHGVRGRIFVRTNEPGSAHLDADLAAALETPIDGLMIPKLGATVDLQRFSAALDAAERRTGRAFRLIGLIETARGVVNVEAIAGSGDAHLDALGFGAEDYITDLDGQRTADGTEVLYARSRVVLAARAAGLAAIDQVVVDIRDDERFRRDAERGRQLGYGGKMCLLPRQAAMANEIFSPSVEEVDRSRRLIQAYEAARAQGRGVIDFEGGMVDQPLLRRARTIVERAGDLDEP